MLRKSIQTFYFVLGLGVCLIASGCCGPIGCGVGCGVPGASCNDCDGSYYVARPIPTSPLDSLRQMKRSLVCGGGCGEVYVGEWMSTPPDACDPCHGSQFVGGATKCTPFCWQPGAIFGNLYGGRFCDGSELVDGSCGDTCCGGCGGVGVGVEVIGGSGCATCDASTLPSQTRVATQVVQQQPVQQIVQQQVQPVRMTAEQAQRKMMAQRQMQQTQSRTARSRTTTSRPAMYR